MDDLPINRSENDTRVANAPAQLSESLHALQDWIEGGSEDERVERRAVGALVKQCWIDPGNTHLTIEHADRVTSLPQIPSPVDELKIEAQGLSTPPDLSRCVQLRTLSMTDCHCLATPPDLSNCPNLETLSIARCTALPALPDTSNCPQLATLEIESYCGEPIAWDLSLHPQLTSLTISNCGVENVPLDLSNCPKLRELKIRGFFGLTRPPDFSKCAHLTSLNMSYLPELTTPPDLSNCPQLTSLEMEVCGSINAPPDLSHCWQLTNLNMTSCENMTTPPNLSNCSRLKFLNLSHCSNLTSLHPFGPMPELRELNLDMTPLTSLPDDLLHLHQDCRISLDATRLSVAVVSRLDHILDAPGYSGPSVRYIRDDAIHGMALRPLHQEVDAWRAEVSTAPQTDDDLAIWRDPPVQDNVASFSTFLSRIRETNDYRNATPALKRATQERVNALLDQLQADPALREDCFNLPFEAVATCGDRVALRLMEMEMLCLSKHAQTAIDAGAYDANPQALFDLCKGQYRLKVLAEEATRKVAGMSFTDEIEVHLGYLVKLKEKYELPIRISTMLYPACSGVTDSDLALAEIRLGNENLTDDEKRANDQSYQTFLAGSPLVRKLLSRVHAEDMARRDADNTRLIQDGKAAITQQLEQLDPAAPDYAAQAQALMRAFHALEIDTPVQATKPVLMTLLEQKQISGGL